MATPSDIHDSEAVETAADFVAYLHLLSADFTEDRRKAKASGNPYYDGSWAHSDMGIFLERWGSWLQAMVVEGRPHYPRDEIDPPSWKSLARQLNAARGYE
ncbi:hypothetical protein SAMN04488564_107455 [Lentzea waywayandensis]|uniref:Uncharacterized protein n=1 Tax=Lentzea waywayandensis TaxID=84724 RepID=A0A1I6F3B1_9PSEU|nr:hypothetical protein [Lentzea waywayandensis]SFR24394.1 hypothetical protein SAMN04488564_107455 [Lentzea waywayandensis]